MNDVRIVQVGDCGVFDAPTPELMPLPCQYLASARTRHEVNEAITEHQIHAHPRYLWTGRSMHEIEKRIQPAPAPKGKR